MQVLYGNFGIEILRKLTIQRAIAVMEVSILTQIYNYL